jgi:hypothetical protein
VARQLENNPMISQKSVYGSTPNSNGARFNTDKRWADTGLGSGRT